MLSRDVHSLKASEPILTTLLGIVMLTRDVHFLKAISGMLAIGDIGQTWVYKV